MGCCMGRFLAVLEGVLQLNVGTTRFRFELESSPEGDSERYEVGEPGANAREGG